MKIAIASVGLFLALFGPLGHSAEPGPSSPVFPADQAEAGHVTATAKLIHDCLVLLYERSSDSDTQYYEDGWWHYLRDTASMDHTVGTGRAAAILWNWQAHAIASGVLPASLQVQATPEKQAWLHRIAVETFNRMIKDYQQPDGSFVNATSPSTYFFAVELVSTYLQLRDSLDAPTRQLWSDTLSKEINHMIFHGQLPDLEKGVAGWYTNGNIELGEAELLYKMWKATGDQKYQELFEAQWNHTLKPKQERWKGFGLVCDHEPTKEDGSDGSGYLSESGGDHPGYDGSYSGVQLSNACGLYVASRDPRVLRVMNLLLNTAMTRVNKEVWTYDATGGTRKNYKGMFCNPAISVAAFQAGRGDLKALVDLQFQKSTKPQYTGAATQNWNAPNFYLGLGTEVAVMLEPYIPATPLK